MAHLTKNSFRRRQIRSGIVWLLLFVAAASLFIYTLAYRKNVDKQLSGDKQIQLIRNHEKSTLDQITNHKFWIFGFLFNYVWGLIKDVFMKLFVTWWHSDSKDANESSLKTSTEFINNTKATQLAADRVVNSSAAAAAERKRKEIKSPVNKSSKNVKPQRTMTSPTKLPTDAAEVHKSKESTEKIIEKPKKMVRFSTVLSPTVEDGKVEESSSTISATVEPERTQSAELLADRAENDEERKGSSEERNEISEIEQPNGDQTSIINENDEERKGSSEERNEISEIEQPNGDQTSINEEMAETFIDSNVKACDDFEKFVCGNFHDYNVDIKTQAYNNVMKGFNSSLMELKDGDDDGPLKWVGIFIELCNTIDVENQTLITQQILNVLETINISAPLLDDKTWNSESFHWTATLVELYEKGFNSINGIQFHFSFDDINNLKLLHTMKVTTIPVEHHNEEYIANVFAEYLNKDKEEIQKDVKLISNFEQHLSNACEKEYVVGKDYSDIKETEDIPFPEWPTVVEKIYKGTIDSSSNDKSTWVQTNDSRCFNAFVELMVKSPPLTLANVFAWRILYFFANYLGDWKNPTDRDRILVCAQQSRKLFPTLSQYLVEERYYTVAIRRELDRILYNEKVIFRERLENGWKFMDEANKIALEKIESVRLAHKYDRLGEGILENIYKNVEKQFVDKYNSYIGMILLAEQQLNDLEIIANNPDLVPKLTTFDAFGRYPTYNVRRNLIEIPAMALVPPLFQETWPDSRKYGGVGYFIAFEIVKSIFGNGTLYGIDGEENHWSDKNNTTEISKLQKCIDTEYKEVYEGDNEIAREIRTNYNDMDAYANLYDLLGMEIANKAYKISMKHRAESKVVPNKEFWISYGTLNCQTLRETDLQYHKMGNPLVLPHYRLTELIKNLGDYFLPDFECDERAKMFKDVETRCFIRD